MRIMSRMASGDLEACITAQAMEDCGATVFSITHNGMHQPHGALIPSSRFIVWARVTDDEMILAVDEAIAKGLDNL